MVNLIKWNKLKEIVNSQGLRISRSCHAQVEGIAEERIEKAIQKAKKEKAKQLRPDHFWDGEEG